MYYVYAISSKINKDLYIGFTADLDQRIKSHNEGKVKSTKANKPWTLVYYEAYLKKEDATKREYQLKQSYFKNELKLRLTESLTAT